MKRSRLFVMICTGVIAAIWSGYHVVTRANLSPSLLPGEMIDAFNGVAVYHNGGMNNTHGRHLSADGYNIGLRYQCVEFVKRYYLERFSHKMPDSYGHARDFFDPALADGNINPKRGMIQYANGSSMPPEPEDLIVFGPTLLNPYGHVAIVTEVGDGSLKIIQQNTFSSRETLSLSTEAGGYRISAQNTLGWLRLPGTFPATR